MAPASGGEAMAVIRARNNDPLRARAYQMLQIGVCSARACHEKMLGLDSAWSFLRALQALNPLGPIRQSRHPSAACLVFCSSIPQVRFPLGFSLRIAFLCLIRKSLLMFEAQTQHRMVPRLSAAELELRSETGVWSWHTASAVQDCPCPCSCPFLLSVSLVDD